MNVTRKGQMQKEERVRYQVRQKHRAFAENSNIIDFQEDSTMPHLTNVQTNESVEEYALRYRNAGLQVMPVRTDGSKGPQLLNWARLQDPAEQCPFGHFSLSHTGIGIVCGRASGGLEVIDFDDPALYPAWCAQIESNASDLLQRLVIVDTPRANKNGERGKHVAYRCPRPRGRHRLDFNVPNGSQGRGAVEALGEGAYILAPGCPACCHTTGRLYEPIQGDLCNLPSISQADRDELLSSARLLTL